MRRALLVDTNFSAEPIRSALKDGGFEVFTVGKNMNDALAGNLENHLNLDYSDSKLMRSVFDELEFQFLIPGCNDRSYEICCEIASEREFIGYESLESIFELHRKDKFRDLCKKLSIPSPKVYCSVSEAASAGGHLMVKPVDSYSGRGIEVLSVLSETNINKAIGVAKRHSPSERVVIEDFVSGKLHSFSAFLRSNKVVQAFTVAEFGVANPYVVDTSYVCAGNPYEAELRENAEAIASELDLCEGLLHLQYICDEHNYWLIEATRRCPGDLYSDLIFRATGFDYAKAYLAPFIKQDLPPRASINTHPIVRHTVNSSQAGIFSSVSFNNLVVPMTWHPLATAGQTLLPSPDGRIGVAFFDARDAGDQEMILQAVCAGDLTRISFLDEIHE